jgi:hypothetical protein
VAAHRGHAHGRSTPDLLARARRRINGHGREVVERHAAPDLLERRQNASPGPPGTIHVYWLAGMSAGPVHHPWPGATNPDRGC